MKFFVVIFILATVLLLLLYWNQEKLIFFPEKLEKQYTFSFSEHYQEKYFTMPDGKKLHALLFKADSSRGVVYYLHGNAGSVNSWGTISSIFTSLHFDLLLLDYRGYGKSEGHISSEQQLFSDVNVVYDSLKIDYPENKIVVTGYSIGTGLAANVAAMHHPARLILMAPYFNFPDLVDQIYPILPAFILKYKLKTNEFLPQVDAPISLFHGLNDELIPYHSSERLRLLCKPSDKLILLDNQTHNGINENPVFQKELERILADVGYN